MISDNYITKIKGVVTFFFWDTVYKRRLS